MSSLALLPPQEKFGSFFFKPISLQMLHPKIQNVTNYCESQPLCSRPVNTAHLVVMTILFWYRVKDQGRVGQKLPDVNPGLNVNWSITFSYLKTLFASNVWCRLRLLQLKTEGQTIQTDYLTAKLQNSDQNSSWPWVSLIGLWTNRPVSHFLI